MTAAAEAALDRDLGTRAPIVRAVRRGPRRLRRRACALVAAVEGGSCDLAVAGFRNRVGGGFGIALGFARWAIERRCGYRASAPLSGQRAMRATVLRDLLPFAHGYGMETGMTIDAVRAGHRIGRWSSTSSTGSRGAAPAASCIAAASSWTSPAPTSRAVSLPAVILAIDQGTTGSTCLVFNREGRIVGRAYSEFEQHFPRPGWVEHDANEIWEVTRGVAADALAEAGIGGGDLDAIGITNQRETVVAWDPATGEPVHHALVWQDRRTAARCDELREAGHEELVRSPPGS